MGTVTLVRTKGIDEPSAVQRPREIGRVGGHEVLDVAAGFVKEVAELGFRRDVHASQTAAVDGAAEDVKAAVFTKELHLLERRDIDWFIGYRPQLSHLASAAVRRKTPCPCL